MLQCPNDRRLLRVIGKARWRREQQVNVRVGIGQGSRFDGARLPAVFGNENENKTVIISFNQLTDYYVLLNTCGHTHTHPFLNGSRLIKTTSCHMNEYEWKPFAIHTRRTLGLMQNTRIRCGMRKCYRQREKLHFRLRSTHVPSDMKSKQLLHVEQCIYLRII